MKKNLFIYAIGALVGLTGFTGCQDMFDIDSDQVINTDDYSLDAPTDSVYSVMGIIHSMQRIADRTILFGELRGELAQLTTSANLDLQALANFTADVENVYNKPQDYYHVIQNCNYFLANVDTALRKRNQPVFIKEFAAVKAFRAWTYLQLAQVYGSVPFITEPINVEKQADPSKYEKKDIQALCEYFIEDLKPFIDTELPGYGSIGGYNSNYFYIPVRLLLGDMCLWTGRYKEAATYYHDYLTHVDAPRPLGTSAVEWYDAMREFDSYSDSWSGVFQSYSGSEHLVIIPMESNKFEGIVSDLVNVFNSTQDNQYYFQATISTAYRELSRQQQNCKVFTYTVDNIIRKDTLYAPAENPWSDDAVGDLRLFSMYTKGTISSPSSSNYSKEYQQISKFGSHVPLYRKTLVYLRYAEAMNRAGFPTTAFSVLKYGLNKDNISLYVDTNEVKAAAGTNLLTWDERYFTVDNTIGIHSRGAGNSAANAFYVIPSLASLNDTINYVENLICDELALESAFEGFRFYDLMRLAMRKDDNTFLATKVAGRKGASQFDQALYNKLLIRDNWFLPLK